MHLEEKLAAAHQWYKAALVVEADELKDVLDPQSTNREGSSLGADAISR